jgi:hypothetical protein
MNQKRIKFLISHFTDIYKDGVEINPIPDNVQVTVFFKDQANEVSYFLPNCIKAELGIEIFIARSWILQAELDKLIS